MKELYSVRTLDTDRLIEVSGYHQIRNERSLYLYQYFGWFKVMHPQLDRIPDDIRLKIDIGLHPWFPATIYDWVQNDERLSAKHRLLLLAQVAPQILDLKRMSRMLYSCRNDAGKWADYPDDTKLVLRANDIVGEPRLFSNCIPHDAPLLPCLLTSLSI